MRTPEHNASFATKLPDASEIKAAQQLLSWISSQPDDHEDSEISVATPNGEIATLQLSPALRMALQEVLGLVSEGRGVELVPVNSELTTQRAADILNVSRPHLVKLLDEGRIPFHKTGSHRRIKAEDVFTYKQQRDGERDRLLSEMAEEDAQYL